VHAAAGDAEASRTGRIAQLSPTHAPPPRSVLSSIDPTNRTLLSLSLSLLSSTPSARHV
jgi:hypothetical protein